MKIVNLITLIALLLLGAHPRASVASASNVVITNIDNSYKFVAAKDGQSIKKIEVNSQTSFPDFVIASP